MGFDELVGRRVIEPSDVEPAEIAGLMRVAQRDIVRIPRVWCRPTSTGHSP